MKKFANKFFIVSTMLLSIVVVVLSMNFYFETANNAFLITSAIFGIIFVVSILNLPYKAEINGHIDLRKAPRNNGVLANGL